MFGSLKFKVPLDFNLLLPWQFYSHLLWAHFAFSSYKLCSLDPLTQLRQLELKLTGIMRGVPSSCLVLLLWCEGLDPRTPVLESVLSPDSISNPSQNTSGWSAGPRYISQIGFGLVVLHLCQPSAGISGVPPCPSLSDF